MFVVWGFPYAMVCLYDTLLGQGFLSSNYPTISQIMPSWVPPAWLIFGMLAFLLVTFEGAYRMNHKQSQTAKSVYSLVWYRHEWWLRTTGGKQNFWDDEREGISLLLIGEIAINIHDRIQVESVELDIGGRICKSNWQSQEFYISEEREVEFDIPLDTTRGTRTATLRAIVDGRPYAPKPFKLDIPQGKQVFRRGDSQN